MKLKFLFLIFVIFLADFPAIQAESASCLDSFRSFSPIEPEVHPTTRNLYYIPVTAWYTDSRCMVVGYTTGVWLYDLAQPDNPLRLSNPANITNVVVNPLDSTIAFNVDYEPIVYLIKANGIATTLSVSGQDVTDISFSPDGNLIAVASVKIVSTHGELNGLFYNPRVQIWDSSNVYRNSITINEGHIVKGLFFSPDNRHLLTDSIHAGYDDDEVIYWDLASASQVWTDEDLFGNIKKWTAYDPVDTSVAIMHDHTVALGGIAGWRDWDDFAGTGINISDATNKERQQQIIVSESCCEEKDKFIAIAFNSNGTELVSSQSDGTIKFWNVSDGKQMGEFASGLTWPQVSFSPNDRFLAAQSEHELLILDIANQQVYAAMPINK